jgi:membrane fusion protein (multidrug efflux system)
MRRASVVATVLLVVGLLVAAGAVATVKVRQHKAGAPAGAAFEPSEAAEFVAAREMPWQPTADLVGTVFAMRAVTVRNELAGVVRYVGFQSGDVVEEGQVLLRQDETSDQADLEAAMAAVRVAEANITQVETQIKLAGLELGRMTELQPRAVAEVELDRARTKVDSARADRGRWLAEVDQAKARVAQLEARLAKLTMKAPFRGRAGMRTVHEGQFLKEGVDVVDLQELTGTIYLDFAIPQQYAPRVQVGATVMATGELLGAEPVGIKVVAVDATVNYDTRNLRVRSVVQNPRGLLVPGMSVQVRVPIEEPRTYVVVPSMAVRRSAYANSVFVVAPDDKDGQTLRAHQRFVKLGQTVGQDVIVLEGLKAGESVAGAGSFKLREGVKIIPGPPADSGGGGKPGAAPPAPKDSAAPGG